MIPSSTLAALRTVSQEAMDSRVQVMIASRVATPMGGGTLTWVPKPNTIMVPCRLGLANQSGSGEHITGDMLFVSPHVVVLTDVQVSVAPEERLQIVNPSFTMIVEVQSSDLPRSNRLTHKYLCRRVS